MRGLTWMLCPAFRLVFTLILLTSFLFRLCVPSSDRQIGLSKRIGRRLTTAVVRDLIPGRADDLREQVNL